MNGPSSGDFKADGEEDNENEEVAVMDPNNIDGENNDGDGNNNDNEDDGEEDSDNDDDEVDDSVSDQNVSRMLASMRAAQEDDEFEKAFKNLMHHSVESVKALGSVKATTDMNRMAIPGIHYY